MVPSDLPGGPVNDGVAHFKNPTKKVRVSRDLWPWAYPGCMLTWSPSCASLVAIRPFACEKKRFAQKFTDGHRRRTPRHCISSFLEWAKKMRQSLCILLIISKTTAQFFVLKLNSYFSKIFYFTLTFDVRELNIWQNYSQIYCFYTVKGSEKSKCCSSCCGVCHELMWLIYYWL